METHHEIVEITKLPDVNGVWEAKVRMRHPKTNNWVLKEKSSSFFPKEWTNKDLIEKLEEAFNTKIKVKPYKHIGKTSCGVEIAFFLRKNEVIGCFPLYS